LFGCTLVRILQNNKGLPFLIRVSLGQ
jgi:hypothetical protein